MFDALRPFAPFDIFRTPSLAQSGGGTPVIPDSALALPLTGSLLPSTGTGTLTHTRATSAWMWRDADGRMWRDYAAGRVLIECPAGELRVEGARRVRNFQAYSQDFTHTTWSKNGVVPPVVTANAAIAPDGTLTADEIDLTPALDCRISSTNQLLGAQNANSTWVFSVYLKAKESAGFVALRGRKSDGTFVTVLGPVTTDSWSRHTLTVVSGNETTSASLVWVGNRSVTGSTCHQFYAWGAQFELKTGLSDQSAPEYLSTNVLSYPFHGAGADGVKYYSTLADGTPIPTNEIAAVVEPQATNLLLNSATLVTQNVTVTAQPYTLSFRGTGSVALSGTYTGSLAGTGEHNRVQLTFTPTAGTLTLTVTGSVTTAVLRAGTIAGTYIPTTTSTVTRNADQLALTNYTLSNAAGTLYFEANATDWAQVGGQLFGDGTEYLLAPITTQSGIRAFDGTNTANGPAGTPSGMMKFAIRWNATTGKMRLAANGALGDEATYDGNWNLGSQLLAYGFAGLVRNFRVYSSAMTDAQMRSLTQ